MKKNLKHYLNPFYWVEKWNLSAEERKRQEAEEEAEAIRNEAAEKINIRLVNRYNDDGAIQAFYALLFEGVIVYTSYEPNADILRRQQELRESYVEAYIGKGFKFL